MKCLMVIDVQNGFLNSKTKHIVKRIHKLIEEHNWDKIIATQFINKENSGFIDIMGWEEMMNKPDIDVEEKISREADIVVQKNGYSALTAEVERIIIENKIKEIYIVGVDTDGCVLSTTIDLFEYNVKPFVLKHYCASTGGVLIHRAGLKILKRTIGKHQVINGRKIDKIRGV